MPFRMGGWYVMPKISVRQAEKFAESLLKGEPNRGKILATIAEDRVRELV